MEEGSGKRKLYVAIAVAVAWMVVASVGMITKVMDGALVSESSKSIFTLVIGLFVAGNVAVHAVNSFGKNGGKK